MKATLERPIKKDIAKSPKKSKKVKATLLYSSMEEAIVNTGYKVSRSEKVKERLQNFEEQEAIQDEFTLEDKEWIDKIDGSKLTINDIL